MVTVGRVLIFLKSDQVRGPRSISNDSASPHQELYSFTCPFRLAYGDSL